MKAIRFESNCLLKQSIFSILNNIRNRITTKPLYSNTIFVSKERVLAYKDQMVPLKKKQHCITFECALYEQFEPFHFFHFFVIHRKQKTIFRAAGTNSTLFSDRKVKRLVNLLFRFIDCERKEKT